jgi:hypothetical protein
VEDVDISGYYYGLIGVERMSSSQGFQSHHNGTGVWSGKSLTVRNSLFHDNVVGIKSFGGNLEVRQSMFARNSAAIAIWDVWSSREKELRGNAITGNDVGLYLALGPTSDIQEELKAANQPELGPSLMTMIDNEIVGIGSMG